MNKGDHLKLAVLISCAIHFFLVLSFPLLKATPDLSPPYWEVSLIRVPQKLRGGMTSPVKEKVYQIPLLRTSQAQRLPLLPPQVKSKGEIRVFLPLPDLKLSLERGVEPFNFSPREKVIKSKLSFPQEAYLSPKSFLPPREKLSYQEKIVKTQPEGPLSRIKGPVGVREIRRMVEPTYPAWAEKYGIKGEVELKFWVLPSGEVSGVEILRTTPGFERSASQALRRWRFEPIEEKVTQWGIITIWFEWGKK